MDLLQECIGSYVHQALTEALQWTSRASRSSPAEENARFEDDGSSLRVKSRENLVVQITKIVQVESPILVWISDSQTHLQVTIATSAAERFKRAQQRRVTEGTLGGIFKLTNFEIVAQHYGPKKTKITMLIHELKHIGSDGSGAFGSPRPIECLYEIQGLLDELQAFRANGPTSNLDARDLAMFKQPSVQSSRPGTASSQINDEETSQAIFATQAPYLPAGKRSRKKAIKNPSLGRRDTYQAAEPNFTGSESEGNLRSCIRAANTTGKDLSKESAAIRGRTNVRQLVENHNKANAVSSMESIPGEMNGKAKTSQTSNGDGLAEQKSKLMNLLGGMSKPRAPTLRAPAAEISLNDDEASSQTPQPSPKVGTEKPFSEQPLSPLPNISVESSERSEPVVHDVSNRISITTRPRLASIAGPRKISKGVTKSREQHPTRIGRREIIILKNQKDLLERSDAWLPPEPGYRAPTANVPIAILEALNKQVDRKAKSEIGSSKEENSTSPSTKLCSRELLPSEDKRSEKGDSESDEPFTASQWPPSSPDQSGLPPDSPIESTNHSATIKDPKSSCEISIHHQTPEPSPNLTRRLSIDSESSGPDMSSRRNSIRKVRAADLPTQLLSSPPAARRKSIRRAAKSSPNSTSTSSESHSSFTASDAYTDEKNYQSNDISSNASQVSYNARRDKVPVLSSPTSSKDVRAVIKAQISPAQTSDIPHTEALPGQTSTNKLASTSTERTGSYIIELAESSDSSSGSESELETTLPQGLAKVKDISNEPHNTKFLPSTASRKNTSVMQVRQTPYDKGHPNLEVKRSSLLAKFKGESRPRREKESTSRIPHSKSGLETSKAENGDIQIVNLISSEKQDSVKGEVTAMSKRATKCSPIQSKPDGSTTESSGFGYAADDTISSIEETYLPIRPIEEPQVLSTQNFRPRKIKSSSMRNVKRKASEPLSLLPNVPKRREHIFARATSDLSYLKSSTQDPRVKGRLMRSEYLSSIAKSGSTKRDPEISTEASKDEASRRSSLETKRSSSKPTDEITTNDNIDRNAPKGRDSVLVHSQMEATKMGKSADDRPTEEASIDTRDSASRSQTLSGSQSNPQQNRRRDLPELDGSMKRTIRTAKSPAPTKASPQDGLFAGSPDSGSETHDQTQPGFTTGERNNASSQTELGNRGTRTSNLSLEDKDSEINAEAFRREQLHRGQNSAPRVLPLPSIDARRPKDSSNTSPLPPPNPIFTINNTACSQPQVPSRNIEAGNSGPIGNSKQREKTSNEPVSGMQQQLGIMNTNTKTEQSPSDQTNDHCKAKAALEERVQATQIALEDSREDVVAVQGARSHLEQLGTAATTETARSTYPVNRLGEDVEPFTLQLEAHVSPTTMLDPESPAGSGSLFGRFKTVYPEYTGNASHFENICKKIMDLVRADRMEHPSLWDDFIIRHRTDYSHYLLQCTEDAMDPIAYERFYKNAIEEPIYTKRVVTPKTMPQRAPNRRLPSQSQHAQMHRGQGQKLGSKNLQGQQRHISNTESRDGSLATSWEPRFQEDILTPNRSNTAANHMAVRTSVATPPQPKKNDPPSSKRSIQQAKSDYETSPKHMQKKAKTTREESPNTGQGAIEVARVDRHDEIVDLTEDDPEVLQNTAREAISPPATSAKRARRSLPWTAPNGTASEERLSSSSAVKAKTLFSHEPSPLRPSSQKHSSERDARPIDGSGRADSKPSPTKSSPAMLPKVLRSVANRVARDEESSTPSARASSTPSKRHTRPDHPSRLGPVEGYHYEDSAPIFRMFRRNAEAIKPGNRNSYANPNNNAGDAVDGVLQGGRHSQGWQHDPFNLHL